MSNKCLDIRLKLFGNKMSFVKWRDYTILSSSWCTNNIRLAPSVHVKFFGNKIPFVKGRDYIVA